MVKVIESDVLVVGGGGAAARAALEAHQAGAKVTLAVKGDFGITGIRGSGATGSGSVNIFRFFPGAPAGTTDEGEVVFKRLTQASLGIADRHLARVLVDDALEARQGLEKWGVILRPIHPYDKIPRWVVPMPGLACVIRGSSEINVQERMMVSDLLIQDGTCVGAIGIGEEDGELFLLKASSTILATGGMAQLFMLNFHPTCVTGDGYAMGYEAGAELINMEFHQIFLATAYPTMNIPAISVWGLCPQIRNVNGDEFIQNYLPQGVTLEECMKQHTLHAPYSTRDASKYLEIAMIKEAKAGRANEHNGFYLEVPPEIRQPITAPTESTSPTMEQLSAWSRQWHSHRGVDWSGKYVEVSVAHHCSNGGLLIDENGQTTIPGLYAVGETSAGAYGADRLGGAMIAACQVFGARAGKHAAATARAGGLPLVHSETAESQLRRIADVKESKGDQKPFQLLKILKKTTWENLLAVRTRESLTQVLKEVEHISKDLVPRLSIENTRELIEALELKNLIQVAEIVASAALMRAETRGSHYREDFPERDDTNWLQSITVKKIAGKMQLGTVKLDEEWEDKPEDLGAGTYWG